MFANISHRGHRHAEPHDPVHFVDRSQMLPRDSERVRRRKASRLTPRLHIELCDDVPK
jgi:hypothetical protein